MQLKVVLIVLEMIALAMNHGQLMVTVMTVPGVLTFIVQIGIVMVADVELKI